MEVVVQCVDDLFVIVGVKSGYNQILGFVVCEQSRVVGLWQEVNLVFNCMNSGGVMVVNMFVGFYNVVVQDVGFEFFYCGVEVCVFKLFFSESGFDCVMCCGNSCGVFLFVG